MSRALLTLAIGTVVAAIPAYAHHSFAAYYVEDQSVSIQGNVHEFQYRNPHAVLVVTAPDQSGRMQKYEAEWAGPTRLERQGITKDTLKPGDFVVVTGAPGRVATEYRVHLKGIHRPSDGWKWAGGRR